MILRISIMVLCIAGFYVYLLGTLIWYAYGYWHGATLIFYQAHYNQTNLSTLGAMTWIPDNSTIILHMKLLTSGFIANTINQDMVNSP